MTMTFIDFFAGLGGFTARLEQAGFKCIGFCEKDKYAVKSYRAIHNPSEKEWFSEDITTLEASGIPYADGWSAGFPCQDISISGKQQTGLNGKRSGLFFEIIRLVKGKAPEDKPRWICLKMLRTFYQSMEAATIRRFCISYPKLDTTVNGSLSIPSHTFPKTESAFSLSDILERTVPEKYFLSESQTQKLLSSL